MTDPIPQLEYKIVRVTALRKKAGAGEQEQLLNEMSLDGWELVDARRSDIWDWESTDSLTLRRRRPVGERT